MHILDLFFPKRCVNCKKIGSYICSQCFTYITFTDVIVCVSCQRPAIGGLTHPVCRTRYGVDGVFPSLVYVGVVKKLIYKFKYPPYLTDLQSTMTELFYEGLIQKEQFYNKFSPESVFVPVPLHSSKFRKRGYNQAQKLGEGLSKKFELPVVDCLTRVKNTKTQVGLSKIEREDNIKDAFAVKEEFVEQIKNIEQVFLVDDVATSGATLRESAKVLKRAGVKYVWGVTLAHGQ
jgi:competence protein ComFC